jgi:6-phosphogluconolactonase (cycloisomerase 2 family)
VRSVEPGHDIVTVRVNAEMPADSMTSPVSGCERSTAVTKRLIRWSILLSALSMMVAVGTTLSAQDSPQSRGLRFRFPGAVYTMSNGVDRNAILVFDRWPDGRLVRAGAVGTGGTGTGAGLGNQGGVVLSGNERWLLAVNAGSNSISVLEVRRRGLRLVEVQPSGGIRPLSVTEHRGLVYVLNAGSDSMTGFVLGRDGRLRPLEGSERPLSGAATDPAQIAFTPGGDALVVTEKATNQIVTFEVGRNGLPGEGRVQDSNGQTPFGFAFGKRDQLFVSEAFGGAEGASATSSYDIDRHGVLTTISASVGTNQTAACWVAVTPNGRFAYVTNTGSGSISGYAIDFDGTIELLDTGGRTASTGDGSAPVDMAFSDSGRFLYSLNSGTNTIGAFRVSPDGSLTRLPFTGGLPPGANGLAAR